ncbi:MAG: hypothetical protein ACRCUP_05935 [Mycoplasmatales bacterium]
MKKNYIRVAHEIISEIEKHEPVMEMQIDSLFVWREIRRIVAYKYYSKFTENANKPQKSNVFHWKLILQKDLINVKKSKKKDVLIFQGNKKEKRGNQFVDPITSFITEDALYIDDMSFKNEYFNQSSETHYFTIRKSILRKTTTVSEISKCTELVEIINQYFTEKLITTAEMINAVKVLKADYKYYQKAFKRLQPKKIYLATGYLNTAIIMAANDLKIETIEIQYALMSKYHIAFSFPNCEQCYPYFAQKLLVWNDYWKKDYLFPTKLETYKHEITKYPQGIQKKKQILVVGQDFVSQEMQRLYNEIEIEGYDKKYKAHPWETVENITVETKTIFELLDESEIVVTCFSSVYYEAMYFDCKVFLLENDLNDVYDEELKEQIISNADDLESKLKNMDVKELFGKKFY